MKVYAHRGASGYQPENTIAAFREALARGSQAIELDVHNVEGELIVFHDRRLSKKHIGDKLTCDLTLIELAELNVEGEPIPTLWQVLTFINGRCEVNIELKGDNTVKPMIAMYPRIINELNFSNDQLLFSSFKHPELAQLKQAIPQVKLAPLIDGVPLNLADVGSLLQADAIHLSLNFVNQAMIDDAHRREIKVQVFTVNHPDDVQLMIEMGVDGIFSDYPDKAMALISKLKSSVSQP
ncbi:MAG: glycerophosphodiester phosphodiesterase [Parashewanella sp.]